MTILEIVSGSLPLLATTRFWVGLVVPVACAWNVMVVPGAKPMDTLAVVPVPDSATVWVPASSAILSVAVRLPVAVGVKVTVTVHVRVGVMDPGMQELVCPKSPGLVPVNVALARLIGTLPVLVRTTFWVLLAKPTGWLLKLRSEEHTSELQSLRHLV